MSNFPDPSTTDAKFIKGTDQYGRLGARRRQLPESGTMSKTKEAKDEVFALGLPRQIRGNPLGCTCHVAHLVSVGRIMDNGEVEADYQCAAGWHNYVVFQLNTLQGKDRKGLRIDKFGNIVEDSSTGIAESLEEF